MDARWLHILFVGALLQGILTFSPIPSEDIPDAEWVRFNEMMRDPAYRLPTTTTPRHYEVSLTPYFEVVPTGITPFTFDGSVTIYLTPQESNVNQIVMHCQDMTIYTLTVTTIVNGIETGVQTDGQIPVCEMPYAFLRINTAQVLNAGQEYVVSMTFNGNIQNDMRGFYRSWYYDNTGKRWMGTTQFQPGHARKAFPCYDEPGFKATFDFTINREADYSPTISNMPIKENVTLASGRVAETFHTTPITSTYLLAFIISHYEVVAATTDTTRPFEIYARSNAGTTGEWSLEIGELLLNAMEQYTNFSYYDMAENMNMKQAAIPDFSAGAMENWGLLTYREALILYDPLNSNHFYRQRVANIVAHEISHMWFGNLVTCAWWDNLWLNEGFARFYTYYLSESVAPEMAFDTRFITEQVHIAMFADSLDSAHALTDPTVNDPTAVSAHFSTITYARGAAVLRMTQHLLGEETFVKGLRQYLVDRQFNVAEPDHLFDALDAAAVEDQALVNYPGLTISEYFKTWSEKAGHPVLTVIVNHETGRITITQSRWERNTGISSFPSLWQIPITWTRAGSPDFTDLKPSQILVDQVTVIDRGTTGQEWVIFNKRETGFYKINYDVTTWGLITRALRSEERTTIHEFNRAQIVNDVFAFARANVLTYNRALNILSFLEFEDEYAPWLAAIDGFSFVIRRVAHDNVRLLELQNEIIRLSTAVVARLGFSEIDGEPYMDGLLRMYVMKFLCDVGHPQCQAAGILNFQNWRNGVFIPANMRPWVYCAGLRAGTADDFNALWTHYLAEDLASEQVVLLEALGCTKDSASLNRYLDEIVADNESVRPQDATNAIYYAINGNEENTLIAFDWIQNNIAETAASLGSAATPISYIAARLLNEADIATFELWASANSAALGTAYNTAVNGAASARNNLQWSAERVPEISSFIAVGYVDDVDDQVEAETDAPDESTAAPDEPTSAPEVSIAPETDSANIVILSVVTLTMSVIVNFVL